MKLVGCSRYRKNDLVSDKKRRQIKYDVHFIYKKHIYKTKTSLETLYLNMRLLFLSGCVNLFQYLNVIVINPDETLSSKKLVEYVTNIVLFIQIGVTVAKGLFQEITF